MSWFPLAKKTEEPVAPRPHLVSILLGLLSPSLALVALAFSLFSYRLSQESLALTRRNTEIAQRAYLSASNSRIAVVEKDSILVTNAFIERENKNGFKYYDVRYMFEVNNLGNTPASIKDARLSFRCDTGIDVRLISPGATQRSHIVTFDNPGDIAPKGSATTGALLTVELSPDAQRVSPLAQHFDGFSHLGNVSTGRVLQIDATVMYGDAFNQIHSISWCSGLTYDDPPKLVSCEKSVTGLAECGKK